MRRWSRPVVGALVAAILFVLAAPDAVLWAASATRRLILTTTRNFGVPRPVLMGAGLVVLFVLTFGIIFGAVRLFTSVGASRGSRIATWYDRVTPNSPQTKALVFMVVFTVVFLVGIAAFVPWLSGSLTKDTGLKGFTNDIQNGRYSGSLPDLFADDAVVRGDRDIARKAAGTDTDGDGLPDSWERAGETPSGASLPGADPNQLDLYVQLNYGSNVSRLTRRERRQLRRTWANMPVENPDGSTGIDLHLVRRGDRAGKLGESVSIDRQRVVDRYYTHERLGSRYCSYHQIVLGTIQDTETIGYAETPGYAAVLDGSRFESYSGGVSFRVAMITHALLHTVVGRVSDGVHTDGGWLDYPSSGNEHLSQPVIDQLERDGFATSSFDRRRCGPAETMTPGGTDQARTTETTVLSTTS
ncbi:MAG: hypothetical protein ABEI57_04850 [Halapricum sp.]